jgi:hypothetical protein
LLTRGGGGQQVDAIDRGVQRQDADRPRETGATAVDRRVVRLPAWDVA